MPPEPLLAAVRALLLLVLLAAPLAAAQAGVVPSNLSVSVEDPGRALVPGANESIGLLLNYRPGAGAQPQPAPTVDRPENTTPTRIALSATQLPSWVASATFEPAVLEVPMGPDAAQGRNYALRATMILVLAPDAPALEREDVVVGAVAEPNGNIAGANAESAPVKLRATTVGKLNVTTEPARVIPGGRWVTIPFTVVNQGNSDIVAKVNVTTRPENSEIQFPETLNLKRGESAVVEVRVRTPWTAAEFGTLELEAVPLVDGEEGEPARGVVEVVGTSAVPAPAAAWLVLLVVGAALARR